MASATGAGAPTAAPTVAPDANRKMFGAWYTPDHLVHLVVDAVVTASFVSGLGGRVARVLDPACGDGRFLRAVSERMRSLGAQCDLVGVDIDPAAAAHARQLVPNARIDVDDALGRTWGTDRFDLVIGNPPFLSQMAAATSRGRASDLGGGPYADVAVEFLSIAAQLVEPLRGRVAFVLPQSILSTRDAGDVRAHFDERAEMIWSWWSAERIFDAGVYVCALAFEFGSTDSGGSGDSWSHVVTTRHRVPWLPEVSTAAGTVGDRARLNANFRDEYYGMIPAVGDHREGPPLITSGLIDPGVSRWGERPVTFARRHFAAPRVDIAELDPKMQTWARQRLVPKVLVANQTRIIEAVCDPTGEWLPAVPVVAVYPLDGSSATAWEIAALLTSPVASAWAWHRNAGTGLSADAIRVGPAVLGAIPWPDRELDGATAALRAGDVRGCAAAVVEAYGLAGSDDLIDWWSGHLDRIDARAGAPRRDS